MESTSRADGDKVKYSVDELDQLYLEFYQDVDVDVPRIQRREIAFQYWGEPGIRDRHRYFETPEGLNKFLRSVPRAAAFHSVAYYLDPQERDNKKKGYQNSDLIFDLDDESVESAWIGMERLGHLCELGKGLIDDFLVEDFGIPLEAIRIEFSGRKGLHITVLSEKHCNLSREARRQLVDYIEGSKVDRSVLFPEKKGYVVCNPNAKGWRKYARRTVEALLNETEGKSLEEVTEVVVAWGFPKVRTKKISALLMQPKIRQAVLEGRLSVLTSKGERTLNDLIKMAIKRHNLGLGGTIDRKVTFDANRILRIPNTLHPKSGLPCVTIDYDDLSNPTAIIDKIRNLVGEDEVCVKLAKETTVEVDSTLTLGVGEHILPRYVAVALLSQAANQ